MKIIYVEDEESLLNLIAMQIEAEIDCQVVEISSGNKAIEWLKKNDSSDVKLIISDHKMPDGPGTILFQYIKENFPHIPFILTSGSDNIIEQDEFQNFFISNPSNTTLVKPFSLEDLTKKINEIISPSIELIRPAYFKISHIRFRRMDHPPCDIYLKLSNDKYVKIFNANEEINQDFIDKYSGKGVDCFYVQQQSFAKFSRYYDEQLKIKLFEAKLPEEILDTQLQIFKNIQDHIQNVGFDVNVITTMNVVTQSTIEMIKSKPDLYRLIENMMTKGDYLSEHSIMISYIAGAMAMEMDWVTSSTLQKLAYTALLHDASLNNSSLAKLSHLPEEEWKKQLSAEDIEMIKKHPRVMAEHIRKSSAIESDVASIIFNHHETADGKGYPRNLEHPMISPLVALFVVAEDFVNAIYNKKTTKKENDKIIYDIQKKFPKGNFVKAVEALRKIINNPFA